MSDMRCMCDGEHDCPIHGMPWPHSPGMSDEDKLRDIAGRLSPAMCGERAFLNSLAERLARWASRTKDEQILAGAVARARRNADAQPSPELMRTFAAIDGSREARD